MNRRDFLKLLGSLPVFGALPQLALAPSVLAEELPEIADLGEDFRLEINGVRFPVISIDLESKEEVINVQSIGSPVVYRAPGLRSQRLRVTAPGGRALSLQRMFYEESRAKITFMIGDAGKFSATGIVTNYSVRFSETALDEVTFTMQLFGLVQAG